jgi:hypothetical protein
MKNIHVLPTDKPSRLVLEIKNNNLFITTTYFKNDLMKHQNIYITSDEEIKEGNYFWKPDCNMIFKAEYTPHKGCQKVILTTDQDLIADGVQAIDDEFLEWFVKNPSCEWVEVEDTCLEVRVCDCAMNENCLKPGYTIIIPQEEPKSEMVVLYEIYGNMHQDPLEEAAKEYSERHLDVSGNLGKYLVGAVFQDGVKWQQERMYSEGDKIMKFLDAEKELKLSDAKTIERIKWYFETYFEQFKKK